MLKLGLCRSLSLTSLIFLLFSPVFTVTALAGPIAVTPTQGVAGTLVTVTGTDWPAGERISLSWSFSPFNTVSSAQAGGVGEFTAVISVPSGAPTGPTRVNAINEAGDLTGQANFTVTAGAPTPPAPPQPQSGWYGNGTSSDTPSIIHEDSNLGLRIVWGNSYIYEHPGNDNLYWYAQVVYYNTGSKPLLIRCPGAQLDTGLVRAEMLDKSQIQEYLRDTEGLSQGSIGTVTADETFCTHNPDYIRFIDPNGAHYTWAIFHNVPPGGTVALKWGDYQSPWANPWQRPLPATPQPAECPRELLESLKTCHVGEPQGAAQNLIVLVHGCCTDVKGLWEYNALADQVVGEIKKSQTSRSPTWEVVVWDWTNSPDDPLSAYYAAAGDGEKLANAINAADTIHKSKDGVPYSYIHLIGHSAGAKLIHEAAQKIADQGNIFIHLTFLDAFTPLLDDYGSGLEKYHGHFAEHYVDKSVLPETGTDNNLKSAHNFDITDWTPVNWDPLCGLPAGPKCFDEKNTGGHQWPRYWYEKSVTAHWYDRATGFRYGYPLSLEGGNIATNKLSMTYPAGECTDLTEVGQASIPLLCGRAHAQ